MDDSNKHHTALLFNLVMMFQSAALQQMGKLKNPISDAIERDMEQARLSIDMLDMLLAKTAGNLSEDEGKFLSHIISELKLNYVDEVNKDKQKSAETAAAGEASAKAGTPESGSGGETAAEPEVAGRNGSEDNPASA